MSLTYRHPARITAYNGGYGACGSGAGQITESDVEPERPCGRIADSFWVGVSVSALRMRRLTVRCSASDGSADQGLRAERRDCASGPRAVSPTLCECGLGIIAVPGVGFLHQPGAGPSGVTAAGARPSIPGVSRSRRSSPHQRAPDDPAYWDQGPCHALARAVSGGVGRSAHE